MPRYGRLRSLGSPLVPLLWALLGLTSTTSSSSASAWKAQPPSAFAPFTAPLDERSLDDGRPAPLWKRQQTCPANYNACSAFAADSICCAAGTDCALDDGGNIACCPRGSFCTGTIEVGTQTASDETTSAGFVAGGGAGGTPTNSFVVPATTDGGVVSPQAVPSAGGAVTNPFYGGFLALSTPFANNDLCSSAYNSCQTEFAKCTSVVGRVDDAAAGGGVVNGVTVSAGAGIGITVPGTSPSVDGLGGLAATATAICQSISAQACQNLQLADCDTLQQASDGASVSTGAAAAVACPTPWPPLYGVGLGVGVLLGVAEQVMAH